MAAPDDANLDELRRRARRRLVGAIVLALAVAVFVPMLLESDPKPLGEDVSVKIPPVDDGKFVNRLNEKGKGEPAKVAKAEPKSEPKSEAPKAPAEAPKSEPPKEEPAKAEAPKAEAPKEAPKEPAKEAPKEAPKEAAKDAPKEVAKEAAPAPQVAKAEPAPAPVSKDAPAKEATPKEGAGKDTPAKDGEFAVQVFAFSDDKGANSLVNKLKGKGFPAYSEPVNTSRGTLWRVRVGPFPTREAANGARDKLKGEGYNGIVAAAK